MELVKNIFFNTDKIVENSEVKLTYAGHLFQNGSEGVFVHYGFGPNWENAQDVEMTKTELGYQANISIPSGEQLNLCFKNSYGEWDNNFGSNYEFKIERHEIEQGNSPETERTTEEAPIVVYKTPSWGDLFKKTFANIINYFSKLFGKNTQNVKN